MHAEIMNIQYYLPKNIIDNHSLSRAFPNKTPQSLRRLSGADQRHIVEPGETPADMAFKAAQQLLDKAETGKHMNRADIDALVLCTEFPDVRAPATSCLLHGRLALPRHCLCLDIPGGCTGFVNALLVAKNLITTGQARHVLLLTAESPSVAISKDDIHLQMLFGDGAAATMVSQSGRESIGEFAYGTDSSGAHALRCDRSGAREAIDSQWLTDNKNDKNGLPFGILKMDGNEVLRLSLATVPKLINDLLEKNRLEADQIDLYIFHQASEFMLNALRKKCKIPEEKFYICMEHCGNTVSSTIPIALHHALQEKRITPDSRVMLVSFGIGFSWAGTILYY